MDLEVNELSNEAERRKDLELDCIEVNKQLIENKHLSGKN